ncbi:MAG: tRNA preQ1(34) S-adenosylmethionine ribosyltransferase-isomerase QueA [Caldilineaceae bacterium]
MLTALFDYDLPPSFIAQQPAAPRDSSRLLVYERASGQVTHRYFRDIGDYLRSGDLLAANNSRVIPARLHGRKATGGKVEIFLLRRLDESDLRWECLVRGRGLGVGARIRVEEWGGDDEEKGLLSAEIEGVTESGTRVVRFSGSPLGVGEIPLPPYITEYGGDRERYQTIYSRPEGSAAAPTAGLHFTPELLADLHARGIGLETVTLHVGLDTFRPVESKRVEDHVIHTEWASLSSAAARRINETTLAGGRIVAVGTTSVRTLEWAATRAQGIDPYDDAACPWQRVAAFTDNVDLFIYPGYRFRAVDMLITNFHLPRSSLLMLVSAFIAQVHPDEPDAGRRILLDLYAEAKREGYRFYSFGDAMVII